MNCRPMDDQVRFCSSHGSSRVGSEVEINSLKVEIVDAGLRLLFLF